ncbi:MAG TPA: quinolinate synthase NadA, partial [Candidatus Paceibacterota bacterium]
MNKLVFAGDILPATEAVALIPEVDLGPPIEVPSIPTDANPVNISEVERQFYRSEINCLKKKTNAIILAHNYEPPDVQDVADYIGDSL